MVAGLARSRGGTADMARQAGGRGGDLTETADDLRNIPQGRSRTMGQSLQSPIVFRPSNHG